MRVEIDKQYFMFLLHVELYLIVGSQGFYSSTVHHATEKL